MNIVLLHGSWHGGWCWHKVVPVLESMGHRVFAPDLPAHGRAWRVARGRTTLNALANSVCELLDSLDAPALLVAHSRGGIVASTVAERRPKKLRGVVYLAAYMLRHNERVIDFFRKDKNSLVSRNIHVSKTLLTDRLEESAYRDALYADCDAADISLAKALLTPEPSLPALTKLRLTPEKYGSVKRHYIELTEDRAVSLTLQRAMIAASPCVSVRSIEASHSAYFSQPRELSVAIDSIAVSN
jgi:pimeloyl-ACP methyl ester carboxylesterase